VLKSATAATDAEDEDEGTVAVAETQNQVAIETSDLAFRSKRKMREWREEM